MKIISYNVNGIRAAVGKGFLEWLQAENPDVLCLQETKAQPEQIPILELESLGYRSYWFSAEKKGYSGVGILTKIEPDHIKFGMDLPIYDREGRFLRIDLGDLSIASIYHPSGSSGDERQDFKMHWLQDFKNYVLNLQKERPQLILCGDYNICHRPIDIHDPVGNARNSGFLPKSAPGSMIFSTTVLRTLSERFTANRTAIRGGVTVLTPAPIIKAGVLIILL